MGIRERLARIEKALEGRVIVIPQRDGTEARFPEGADREAFVNAMARLGAGEGAPPEHPLLVAARNSDEPEWAASVYAIDDPDAWTAPIPDLSEGAGP